MFFHHVVSLIIAFGLACTIPMPACAEPAAGDAIPAYSAIDELALKTPAEAETSVESLVKYLTSGARNDLEKTRAIFRWVTANIAFDPSALGATSPQKVDVNQILKEKRTICMGYSEIFYILGKAAGLEVERIAGFARGFTTANGSPCNSPPNHEWNAVKIDGEWKLIDCTWGTGYMEPGPKFVKRYEEYYFCTPPEQFIFDHYPVDPNWQLLPKPLSCQEYEQLAILKPAFFKYGLGLDSHHQPNLKATDPVEISFTAKQDVIMLAQLTRGQEQLPRSYTFVEKDGDKMKVTAAFPQSGTYTLRLFAKPKTSTGTNCEWVAEYRIEVDSLPKPCVCFPESLTAFLELDAKLIAPRVGKLESGTTQQFRVAVPGAKVVAVISGKKWAYLQKAGDVFEGPVEVTSEPMQVCANFGNSREYQVLLTYNKTTP